MENPKFDLLDRRGVHRPNPIEQATDAEWWLWLRLQELEPASLLGGIFADKKGFHQTGNANRREWPTNYSIRHSVNQSGPGMTHASALDWTFPDAQNGDYRTIDKYTSRLVASSLDQRDPRLDLVLFEFYGQADNDRQVEGRNEYTEENVTANDTHLWHLHFSFLRSKCGSFWGMWAIYTVLAGWSVAKWRDSLPATDPNSSHFDGGGGSPAPRPTPRPTPAPTKLKEYALGSRTLKGGVAPGTDVQFVQKWIGSKHMGPADGIPGPKFTAGVKWYQRYRKIMKNPDGVVTKGGATWRHMGVR